AMAAEAQAVVDSADAMLVERADIVGNLRQVVVRLLIRPQRSRTQERHELVEYAGVACGRDIAARRKGEPKVVIGEVRAYASAHGGMPQMLHIPLVELVSGGMK